MSTMRVLFVVVTVCVLQDIQGASTNTTANVSNDLLGEAVKSAKAVIQRVEQQIQSVAQQVQSQVQNSLDQIKRFGSNLTSQAKSKAEEFYIQIRNTVEQAKEKAQVGIDINECISQALEAKDLLSSKSEQLDSCVLSETSDVQKLVDNFQKVIEDAETFLGHAREVLSECLQAPLTAVQCLGDYTTQTINDAVRVVTDLGQIGQAVRQEITSKVFKIGSCVQDNVLKIKLEAQKVVNDFSACFAGKQNFD